MRLTKKDEARATGELLALIGKHPGIRTSELSGTPAFHGMRTLTGRQIIRLLRASGRAVQRLEGSGPRTWFTWRLKELREKGGRRR